MKLCQLGIHKYNKWQDFGQPIKILTCDTLYNFQMSDWYLSHYAQKQKRTCENCGRVQTTRYRV